MLGLRLATSPRASGSVARAISSSSRPRPTPTTIARARPSLSFSTSSASRAQQAGDDGKKKSGGDGDEDSQRSGFFKFLNSTAGETALGASAGVLLLGFAAMGYQSWYKAHVLHKMEDAFAPGYDPVLHLHKTGDQQAHVRVEPPRPEEDLVRSIVGGKEAGRYFLILGPKGTGKTSCIIDAMAETNADGCAFFEAHEDNSVVADRFSESINYSQNRDYLGNLLGLSDLSGMGNYQALERALHKLEKALIRYQSRTGRPAVIVMNHAHLLKQDEEGVKLLQLFQQRAEKWAGAGTATFVFVSNDYFVYDILRKNSNRMDTLTFKDVNREQARKVLRDCRRYYWKEDVGDDVFEEVYQTVGGRLGLLNRISRRHDMGAAVRQLVEDDMQWLLSKTGMIADHDDDVMDAMKWASCSWLLFQALAEKHREMEEEVDAEKQRHGERRHGHDDASDSSEAAPADITDPTVDDRPASDIPNPYLTWGEARVVMTRPDFIMELDHKNIIHIDRHHHIRADSLPMLRAWRRVVESEGFQELLEQTMDRVSAIESLGRTRELVWKEQGDRGKFLVRSDYRGREIESWTLLGGDERLGREEDDADGAK